MRLFVSSFLAVALVACVSNNGPSGPNQGELGGPCFANDTCKDNLVCSLANGSAVCQQPDGSSTDAVADQGAPDSIAPGDASEGGQGGDAGEGGTCNVQPARACLNQQCVGTGMPECCAQSGQCVASSADCNNLTTWTCTAKADCPSNGSCCIAGSVAQASACPPTWMVNGGASCNANACTGSYYEVCTSSSECPPAHPTCTAVDIQGIGYTVGLCL